MSKKGSGILLHIKSLPSQYGIGDFGPAAYNFVDFLIQTKQTYWQILPLNRPNAASGGSPYFSTSAFAMNPLLISPESLLSEKLLTKEDLVPIPRFKLDKIDYEAVAKYKYGILNIAYDNFLQKQDKQKFEEFCAEEKDWLEDYALFVALKEKFGGKVWNKWPEEIRNRNIDSLEKEKQVLVKEITREKFFQYILFRQWDALKNYCNEKGIKIIGDVPIYVSYDSEDVWAHGDIFKLDEEKKPYVVSGVPPDYFSDTGQLWNNPVYRWDVLGQTKYYWWIKRLEHTFRFFDIVRVDHFRGLVQYWEVPSGEETAINGTWQDVPTYEFFDLLIKHFKEFPIFAGPCIIAPCAIDTFSSIIT